MKRNNIILLAIVVIVGVIMGVKYLLDQKEKNAHWQTDDFAVKDTAQINKIFLSDKSGARALLERTDNGWTINEKYKAFQASVKVLLMTISRIEIKSEVPDPAYNNVITQLASRAIKVEIYHDKKLLKSYYVGIATPDGKGTYVIMEKHGKVADQPFIADVFGQEGSLTPRYYTNEELWRDRTVFDYSPKEIKSVSVDYPAIPKFSFQLTANGELYELRGKGQENLNADEQPDMLRIAQYLTNYKAIAFEAFDNTNSKRDSITATTPFCIITVEDAQGVKNTAKLWHYPVTERTIQQFDVKTDQPVPFDPDRFYALVNNGNDFVLAQSLIFGKVMLIYEYFLTPVKPK